MSEAELTTATQSALRPSGLGQLESSIATELAIAIFNARPLDKVRHIMEAFLLLPEESRNKITSEGEIPLFRAMHTLSISFLDMQFLVDPWGEKYAMVPFPFAPNIAEYYLNHFIHIIYYSESMSEDLRGRLKRGDPEAKTQYYRWLARELSSNCSVQRCFSVKNQFIMYAMPKAVNLARTIIEKFITKETWEAALAATLGKGAKSGSSSAEILTS